MTAKKRKGDLPSPASPATGELPAPNAGELDVLGVLWQEKQGENLPLQLSEVYRRVCERRRKYGEPEPALTTVSTHLRNLIDKKLIEEFVASRQAGSPSAAGPLVRTRGGYRPPTRSPFTSYRAVYEPGQVLYTTFYGLAEAYPPEKPLNALLDFARALGLPEETLGRLVKVVEAEKAAGGEAGAE
jgi:hypothetical protein